MAGNQARRVVRGAVSKPAYTVVRGKVCRFGFDIERLRGQWSEDDVVRAIIQVDEPSYLPENMTLSREIGNNGIKTVTFRFGDLSAFEADPHILRLSMPTPIYPASQ